MSKRTEFAISLKLLTEKFKRGLDGVKGSLNKFKNSISGAFSTREISGFTKSVNGMGSAFSSQMKNIKSQMGGMQTHISNLGKTIAGVFAVDKLIDFGKSIINVGASFQDQMARVQAVSNATKEEFEEMRKEAERLGETTRYSASEAAKALESLVRNGLKAKEATKALSGVLQLAGSQAIELSEAADIATAAMNGFGKEVTDLNRINDILAATCSNSATNVKELAEGLKVAAPVAKVLDISMEEVCAALGTFANVGIKGSQAGTALRIMLNRLVAVTPKGAEALKKYGLSISEADVKGQNFTKTLEKLAKAGMSLSDLKAIFGEEASAASAALLGNFSGFSKTKVTLENSEGEAARQFNQGQGEYNKAVAELSSTWEDFLIRLFDKTKGIFTGLINGIKSVVEELKKGSTYVALAVSGIAVAIGRFYKKVQEEFKQNLAKNQTAFNKDLLASIIVKGEGDPNDPFMKTTSSMQSRISDIKGLIITIEGLYDQMSDSDKKSAEEAIKLGEKYIDTLEQRIAYTNKLISLKEVKDPGDPPEMPKHYSELLKGNKVADFARDLGDVADEIGNTSGLVNDLNDAFNKTGGELDETGQKINAGVGKVEKYSKAVKLGSRALEGFARGFKRAKEWLKHSDSFVGGEKKESTGYYTGKDSLEFETKAYEERKKLWDKEKEAYEEYLDKKANLTREQEAQVKKSRHMMEEAMKVSGKSFQELENYDYEEGLQGFFDGIQKAKKERDELLKTGIWKKLGNTLASLGKSIYNMVGGWIGILTTIVTAVGKRIYDYYQEQNKVFKELKEEQKRIIKQYSAMETKVMSLIGVMKEYDKETIAWKAAKDQLNSSYPELFKNMNLEKIYAEMNGEEYKKLEKRIKSVIAQQKEYMINEHKRAAIQKLQDDFIEKVDSKGIFGSTSLGERITNIFASGTDKEGLKIQKEAATILSAQLKDDILSMLTEGRGVADIEKHIRDMFSKYNVGQNSLSMYYAGGSKGIAESFYNKYEKYRKEIESINKLDSDSGISPEQLIFDIVELALDNFKDQVELKTSEGKAKNHTEEEINSAIEAIREEALNKLVEDLQGISSKIDNKSALEYAKSLGLFDELLPKTAKKNGGTGGTTTTITTETTGTGDSKTPKQLFDETKKYIDALKDAGIIDEKEYRERLLSAYDTYISGLESLKKTDDESLELIKTLNKERDKLKDQIKAAADAEENMKKINEELAEKRKRELEEDQERGKEASEIEKAGLKAKDRRDNYPKYNELNGVFASDILEGSVLMPLEHDLQKLDDYLSDLNSISSIEEINDQLEQIENLKGEGVEALRKQLNLLKDEIINAEEAANDLDEKIQLRRAKKEIQDMTDEVGLMGYETGKGLFTTVDGLVNSLEELHKNWDEMDFGEQMIQGMFGTIDAIISVVQMIRQLQEAWELLSFKKKALTAATVTAEQTEAAAVVAAEAEKTAAITGAVAAQTTATLAAKAAQTKAATIAMAAESTAAYAAIPFAGVGLAAAQIAEMEALIAAAAALPMFAEGGIVGGTKYVGDQNLARVNSGEMIINRGQQKKLWDAISGGKYGSNNSLSGNVEFKISGQVLRGVLNNHDKKMSKIKG